MTTKAFNQQYHCSNCKTVQTQETLFGRWIRNNPEDSGEGYTVTDQDYWIHKYKHYGNRSFQCLMLLEIKTMGASLSMSQRDTLFIVNQLMRNRRQTPTKDLKYQAGGGVASVYSIANNSHIILKAFGMHVLTFSGLGVEDSEWIKWDNNDIDAEVLTQLLRFDLDPDTLNLLDLRSHHLTHENQSLSLEF